MPELDGDAGMGLGSAAATVWQARQPALTQRPAAPEAASAHLRELFDEGTFAALDPWRQGSHPAYGERVVTGSGSVEGRRVFAYGHDASLAARGLGAGQVAKISRLMGLAHRTGAPLVALCGADRPRVPAEVVAAGAGERAGIGDLLRGHVRTSGVIPQIGVVLGRHVMPQYALTDFVFTLSGGPHQEGAIVHDTKASLLADVRRLLSLLPSNNCEQPPDEITFDPLDRRCPALDDVHDIRLVIDDIVDDGTAFEVHRGRSRSVLCALARLGGRVVGILAHRPKHRTGSVGAWVPGQAARFVTLCDAFSIPLVTLTDTAEHLPTHGSTHRSSEQAQLTYAYVSATVPRISVVLRGPVGGALLATGALGADLNLAWASGACALSAAEQGVVDEVIDPADSRRALIRALSMLQTKRADPPFRKHGIPPL